MAIVLKVTWVDQADRLELHQRVEHIGGDSLACPWRHTREQAIDFIERGQFCYYLESGIRTLRLDVGQAEDGTKYLKVDRESIQLLLDLPPMPKELLDRP